MSDNKRSRVLIVEDAQGLATLYGQMLNDSGHTVTICGNPKLVNLLIENGETFDLAILDIVLPPEDLELYSLQDCHRTGIRLMERMIRRMACNRFYVITGLKDIQQQAEAICGKSALLLFEYKLDYEPEEFVKNVDALLSRGFCASG